MLTADGVRDLIRTEIAVEMSGGQAGWAKRHDLSPAYVSDVLSDRREPGPKICAAVGVVRMTVYLNAGEAALPAPLPGKD